MEGIGLICGADDILGAANPTYAQKLRILKQIEDLPADLVLLDLGAGTSYNILDFFNYSQGRICVMTNQATSLQNVYGFIKSALYRRITREFAKDHDMLRMVHQTEATPSESKVESVKELLVQLQEGGEERLSRFSQLVKTFELFLVVNMVKEDADLQAARIIEKVCGSFLSFVPKLLGHISYDPAIEKAVNQMVPFPLNEENSSAAMDLKEIARLVLANCYSQVGLGDGSREEGNAPDVPSEKGLLTDAVGPGAGAGDEEETRDGAGGHRNTGENCMPLLASPEPRTAGLSVGLPVPRALVTRVGKLELRIPLKRVGGIY